MKKTNILFKITSLLTLSTTAVFAALYGVEFAKNDSQTPPTPLDPKIYCESFTCEKFIDTPASTEHKFEFKNITTKSDEKIEMTADNFGLIATEELNLNAAGVITKGAFRGDSFHDTQKGDPGFDPQLTIPDSASIQTLTWTYGHSFFQYLGSDKIDLILTTKSIIFNLIYFKNISEKRYDNFEFVYAKNDEKISVSFNCTHSCG